MECGRTNRLRGSFWGSRRSLLWRWRHQLAGSRSTWRCDVTTNDDVLILDGFYDLFDDSSHLLFACSWRRLQIGVTASTPWLQNRHVSYLLIWQAIIIIISVYSHLGCLTVIHVTVIHASIPLVNAIFRNYYKMYVRFVASTLFILKFNPELHGAAKSNPLSCTYRQPQNNKHENIAEQTTKYCE